MFWYAPWWSSTNAGGTGPGDWGRLIEVGSYTPDSSYGWWSIYLDDGGNNLYFSAQTNDFSSNVWTYLSAPISWTTNRWHLLAITYSSTNSALYIDGEVVTNGPPVTCWPGPDVLANGFYIGSDSNGVAQMHGMFDQMATYANLLDSNSVSKAFNWQQIPYYLNLENVGNLSPAPSTPQQTPYFRAITGAGYLQYVGSVSPCATNSNVWMTNVSVTHLTNGTENITFTIMGGDPSQMYDVLGTAGLVGQSITNALWVWLGQGSPCNRYTITNLPGAGAFLILGTPWDSDGDGLPDALEILWTKTDPHNPDTDGDGIWDWFGPAYFGTNGFDPYALCASGDGWTFLEVYRNGWDPRAYYTPPAPRGLTVRYHAASNSASVSWGPSPGGVTGYLLQRYDPASNITNSFWLSANTNNFEDSTINQSPSSQWFGAMTYRLQAQYGSNGSGWTPWVPLVLARPEWGCLAPARPARSSLPRCGGSAGVGVNRGCGVGGYRVVGQHQLGVACERVHQWCVSCARLLGASSAGLRNLVSGCAGLKRHPQGFHTRLRWR